MSVTDSVYLSSVMGRPLALCLQELTEMRPRDPIEWMAHWLYKWRDSQAAIRHNAKFYKNLVRTEKAIRLEAVSRSDKIRALKRTTAALNNENIERETDPKRSIFVDRLYQIQNNRRQSKRNDRDDSIVRKKRRTKRKVSYGTDSDETDESSKTVIPKRMKKQRKRYFGDTAAAAEEEDDDEEEEELYVKTKSKKRKHDKRKRYFDDKEGEEEVEEEVDLKTKSKRRKHDKRRREVDDKNEEKEEVVDLKTTSRKRKYAKRRSDFDDKDEEEVDLQKEYKKRKNHKRKRDFDEKDDKEEEEEEEEEEPNLQKESKKPNHDADYSYECSSDSDSSLIFDAQNKRWMDYVGSDDDDSDRLNAKQNKKEQETNIKYKRRPPGPSGSGRPSVARWAVTSRLALVCQHPVLGDLQPRPAIVYPETPDWWHRQGYLPRTLYDHEVYSNANEDTIKNWDNMEHMSYKDFITSGPWLSGCLQNATASYRALVHVPGEFAQHLSEEVKAELVENTRKISKKKLKAVKKESKRDAHAGKTSTSGS